MTNIIQFTDPFSRGSAISEDSYPIAVSKVASQLEALTSLQPNWDSYNAKPPSTNALLGAIQLASYTFQITTPTPDVFPTPNGNIQFEWSICNYDIEIEIESGSKCIVSYMDLNADNEWKEKTLTTNLAMLTNLIKELTRRYVDEFESKSSENVA
ncbi:hypothetical protein O5O45_20440 [Hahella aquimaris]|uniref:hypothetical protein n=1 Tax=Hahella sp. HNIBRBA332 TaxID=3015983 RepID=UPI00273AA909|nr:hypothetical protein [Hahella sp. HNIBRBA332]WLQ12097.1 hypothetical protein O5O45_20440 [Hahella sp. HNIBRBA332]